jgi:NitT/TauT family transport system ATP-binding protein
MDEPFQSLDIPLRLELMSLTEELVMAEKRLLVMVTHDPREAVCLARRVIVLGNGAAGIVFDAAADLAPEERQFFGASPRAEALAARLYGALR